MSIFGQLVYVGWFMPKNARKSEAVKSAFNNVYVKSFPPDTTDELLKEMFSEFGDISSCCVAVDDDGKSKGFGFVCFYDPAHAEAAVKAMHGKEVAGRQLYVNRAQRKEERQEELKLRLEKQKAERQSKYSRGVNLYVKNLDDTIDDAALEEAFASYGSITSAKVMRDAQGRSKGFGFVCFHRADEATKAIVEMNNFLLGSKPLYVALAQRKDERRQKMLSGLTERMSHASRMSVAPVMPTGAPGFFQPAVYPRAPAYYHQQSLIGSQPRWNRPAGLPAGVPAQLGVPTRQIPGHYLGGPNAGMPQSHMVQLAHLRSPNNFTRPMMQGNMQSVTPIVSHGMLTNNPAQARDVGTRASVPQYIAANGPNMASVVANGSPSMRMVQQQARPAQPSLVGVNSNVRFNQVSRAAMPNQVNQAAGAPSVLAPLGDQMPVRPPANQAGLKAELGERLFPLVAETEPERAAKVTGMLLGLEVPEIMHLLQSKEALDTKLKEAIAVLEGGAQKADSGESSGVSSGTMPSADVALQNRGDVNGVAPDMSRKETA